MAQAASRYLNEFQGQKVTAQFVETARGEWKNHVEHVWGGAGGVIHKAAGCVQKMAGMAIVGSAPTLVIPGLGEMVEGSAGLVYAFASAVKGLIRTHAENRAITHAGGTSADHAGIGRTLGNIVKEALPFFNPK